MKPAPLTIGQAKLRGLPPPLSDRERAERAAARRRRAHARRATILAARRDRDAHLTAAHDRFKRDIGYRALDAALGDWRAKADAALNIPTRKATQ